MARKISPLAASVTLNLNSWTAGIKQVQRDSRAITASLRPIVDVGKQIGSALTAAGLLVGGALVGMSKKAADFGDALLDASKKTGMSTESLAAYKLLADQSGTSFEALSKGVGLLSKNIVAAAAGSKEQAKLFNALGIAVKDASGQLRNASDIMPEIAERFAKIEDGSLKSALAMKLFGKAGAELIPLLNEGAAGLQRSREQAEKFGIALTRAEAELGDKFNDSLADSQAAMQGFSNAIGIALLPKLTELVNKTNDWIAVASKWVKAHPELTKQIGATAAALLGTGGLILGLTAIVSIVPKVYEGIMLISAGFKLLGASSIGATTGVIGLLAAISTAVNLLPKLAIDRFLPDPVQLGRNLRGIVDPSSIPGPSQPKAPGLPSNWIELSGKGASGASDMENQLQKLMSAFTKTGDGASKAASQVDQMWASLKREAGEVEALEAVLLRAHATGMSFENIHDKLGGTIADVAKEFANAGQPMPEIIAYYNSMIRQSKEMADAKIEEVEAIMAANRALADSADFWKAESVALQGNLRVTEELTITRDQDTDRIIENAVALGKHRQEVNRGTDAYEMAMRKMRQVDALRQSWGDAFASISDQLVDMIVDFDFSFKRLGDIAKNTAKDLARSFLDGFFKPFKDQMEGLGQKAGQALGNILFGGSGGGGSQQQGSGGILGGIIGGGSGGGILGGIFGGGSGGSGGTPPFVNNGGGLSSMMKFDPFSAANSLFDLGTKITDKIGKGRDSANEVVKSQNAFVDTIGGIINDSGLSASNRLKQVNNVWQDMQANLARFSAAGGEGGVTSNQAFATLSPFITKIQADLIKAGATDATGGEGGITVTINNNFSGINDEAAVKQWMRDNSGGLTEEVIRQVKLRAPALVSV